MSLYLVTSIFAIPYRVSLLFVWLKLFSCIMGCARVCVRVCVCAAPWFVCVRHDSFLFAPQFIHSVPWLKEESSIMNHEHVCAMSRSCSRVHHNLFRVYSDSHGRVTSSFIKMCAPRLVHAIALLCIDWTHCEYFTITSEILATIKRRIPKNSPPLMSGSGLIFILRPLPLIILLRPLPLIRGGEFLGKVWISRNVCTSTQCVHLDICIVHRDSCGRATSWMLQS